MGCAQVTPSNSALSFSGAAQMLLPGVTHFPWSEVLGGQWVAPELAKEHREGKPWYGSQEAVEQWASWIIKSNPIDNSPS